MRLGAGHRHRGGEHGVDHTAGRLGGGRANGILPHDVEAEPLGGLGERTRAEAAGEVRREPRISRPPERRLRREQRDEDHDHADERQHDPWTYPPDHRA
jgi:hypothetical protein